MHNIKIGNNTWRFRSSFGDFNLANIIPYMNISAKIEAVHDHYMATYKSIAPLENKLMKELDITKADELKKLISFTRNECSVLQMQIHLDRIDLLSSLCTKSEQFKHWALNTNGVDKGIIDACLGALSKKLGSFTDYWNSVPIVNSFKFKTGRFFYTKFKVHDMDKTTLYRETIAYNIANRAMSHRDKLDTGVFEDVCEFVATLVRPAKQKEEISFNGKSFLSGKKTKGLSSLEKTNLYVEEIDKIVAIRKEQFKELPLSTGIGVILCYYQKKKN